MSVLLHRLVSCSLPTFIWQCRHPLSTLRLGASHGSHWNPQIKVTFCLLLLETSTGAAGCWAWLHSNPAVGEVWAGTSSKRQQFWGPAVAAGAESLLHPSGPRLLACKELQAGRSRRELMQDHSLGFLFHLCQRLRVSLSFLACLMGTWWSTFLCKAPVRQWGSGYCGFTYTFPVCMTKMMLVGLVIPQQDLNHSDGSFKIKKKGGGGEK